MAVLVSGAHAQTEIARASFDASAEGWTIRTNNDVCGVTSLVALTPVYVAAGGNPGGFIQHVDPREGRDSYFRSPIAPVVTLFHGDLSIVYSGTLSYDLQQSATDGQYNANDVILFGGGLTLVFNTQYNPRTTWTRYDVPLLAGTGWRMNRCDGAPATEAQIRQALANVTGWMIRAEFRSGADIDGIDNVRLITASSPLPSPVSTFDTDREGWWVLADAAPLYDAAGGNPGGAFRGDDLTTGAGYSFLAPPKFLGDRTSVIGKTLMIDLRVTPAKDDFFPGANFVEFSNGVVNLGYYEGHPIAGNVWRRHAVPLVPSPGWKHVSNGKVATPQEFAALFGGIVRFIIRGEYRDGPETGRIDNVRLGTCDPSAFASPDKPRYCVGATATFNVAIGGDAPFAFQWRRNGVNLVNGVRVFGATTGELVLSGVSKSDAGKYDCLVTNACGSATSNPALLFTNSADFDGDGDEGTDADVESFFIVLAGGVCPTGTCGSIDFDADGDVGTDADIEAFFRVIAGGSC